MTAQARLLGGRYQVGELLGYGGMAEVHRGRDLRLGRDVAIKLLRTDLARDQTFQERFRREAQNAAALNHPAIVAVYDTGEEIAATGEKLPFIVMEFVNGHTLKEVLAAEQRLMPRRALEITADICAALEFSHRHGIIHRDIKPGNVMLTQNGQVKVMDFGIARALASGATTMTQTSAVIGTAQYLSPEQARGEAVDARSDVYAAGCVLFELLCGHPPFVGDSPVSVAYQHVREDPPTPSDINRDVPPDVDAIILKALAKNPLNRYQSAQEMRADVLRAVAGRPVMATPVLREDETVAMAPAPRMGGTAIRTVPAGVAGPPPRRRTSSWVMATLAGLGVLAVVALVVGLVLSQDPGNQPAAVTAPQLVGRTLADATAEAKKFQLNVVQGEAVEDANCDKGKVANQTPPQGQGMQQGQTITVQMCLGPGEVQVPNLSGTNREAAERALDENKLKAKFDEIDSDLPKGQVVDWSPKGSVAPGTTITVQISKSTRVEVPRVVGLSQDAAERVLEAAKFKVKVEKEKVEAGQPAVVLDQDPNPGEKRNTGSTVTITVAVPAEPDPEPTDPVTPTPDPTAPGEGGGLPDLLD